ncbi:hypothetical protein ACFQL1_06490 [Halomicroarcula sp. GCM10025709]|uniref:hypothetical protein n=1 Tax=Halomicroarcula sp. GCM10025709 TaxID=3252669 RepID=UPI0036195F88
MRFDIAVASTTRRVRAFAERSTSEGVAATIDAAEAVETHEYERIESVDVHDGGQFGRPTVVVRSADGTVASMRVHSVVITAICIATAFPNS